MKLSNRELILLLLIIIVGLFLRIYNLEKESFWVDEGYSVVTSGLDLIKIVEAARKDVHPPLYYLILHFWMGWFGDSEFSVRFLSALLGTLSIFVTYKVGSLIFDNKTGLLGSLILGFSVFHIWYSQETRNYNLMVLLTLFSYYFFIRLLVKKNIKILSGYVIFSSLLMYTHVYGLFILISQNVYFAIHNLSQQNCKTSAKTWCLLQFVLLVLYIPWIIPLIEQISSIQTGFWIPKPTIKSVGGAFLKYSGSYSLMLFFVAFSALALVSPEKIEGRINLRNPIESAAGYLWKVRLSHVDKSFMLLIWLFVPIVLPFMISQFTTPIYLKTYTIGASPAFYLLASKGIRNITDKLAASAVIVALVVLSLISIKEYYIEINKEQWREVASHIDNKAATGDLILMNDGFHTRYVFDYYFKRTDVDKKPFTGKTKFIDEKNITELEPTVKRYRRIWLLLSHSGDTEGLIIRRLAETCRLIYHKKYVGIDLYMLEK